MCKINGKINLNVVTQKEAKDLAQVIFRIKIFYQMNYHRKQTKNVSRLFRNRLMVNSYGKFRRFLSLLSYQTYFKI